jgi:hexosaminidase
MVRIVQCAVLFVAWSVSSLVRDPSALAAPSLVPLPVEMAMGEGTFKLTSKTAVVVDGEAVAKGQYLLDILSKATGFHLSLQAKLPNQDFIHLRLEDNLPAKLGAEGYALKITPQGVSIAARKTAGLFYGIQTLRQLLPPDIYRTAPVDRVEWKIPCVEITDYPRFAWRGLLIDPARHFIPKADVLRFIDAMALHKFNRLQIHLTDSEGWRLEIKKYPLLTETGSRWHFNMPDSIEESKVYGGYYTQADICEIVRYAADRHITVVPEIEMPHHAGAAIVAYPELGPNPDELKSLPPSRRRSRAGHLVVPRDSTITFFKNVIDEVIQLFPDEYIHIGGDEATTELWADLPEMQSLMKREGLKDVRELHSWFIRQIDAHITDRGRKMVGWDEILQGGLADGATVMSWRGAAGGIAAAKAGHNVIMAPMSHTYFDFAQALNGEDEFIGPNETRTVLLDDAYSFEPVPAELTAEQARHILGGQGQLWGEFISNERQREYQTFPRACALIERLWSPKDHSDLRHFTTRLQFHLQRLTAAGIYFRSIKDIDHRNSP